MDAKGQTEPWGLGFMVRVRVGERLMLDKVVGLGTCRSSCECYCVESGY